MNLESIHDLYVLIDRQIPYSSELYHFKLWVATGRVHISLVYNGIEMIKGVGKTEEEAILDITSALFLKGLAEYESDVNEQVYKDQKQVRSTE